MKKALLKIEAEDHKPLEITINGRPISHPLEKAAFFGAVVLLALGAILLAIFVLLPLFGIAVGFLFSLLGIAFVILGLVLAIFIISAPIWALLSLAIQRFRGGRRGKR